MIPVPDWISAPCRVPDRLAGEQARRRQDRLTKPMGALGRLEWLAIRLAGLQGEPLPRVDPVRLVLFAGDHGVVAEGVSAYPQSVTNQMVANIAAGGAAISVLARSLGATLEVVDCGTGIDPGPIPGVRRERLGPGTANMASTPAMSIDQALGALVIGRGAALCAQGAGARLLVGGEMGIGNSTSAAALGCGLLGLPAADLVGPGTGLDPAGIARKTRTVDAALALHAPPGAERDPLELLARLGGFEIAALAGCFLACAQVGVPALVDGFIATAAALVACGLNPGVRDWLLFGHRSAEPGHGRMLAALDAEPLLDLGMRLGEGSGAAVAVPILRLACALHSGMATFEEAGVSGSGP